MGTPTDDKARRGEESAEGQPGEGRAGAVDVSETEEPLTVEYLVAHVRYVELLSAIRNIKASFNDATAEIDRFVVEAAGLSKDVREASGPLLAETVQNWAQCLEPVRTPALQAAARGLIDRVEDALRSGYPDHVLKIEGPLMERGRAEWGRICIAKRCWLIPDEHYPEEPPEYGANDLRHMLVKIDERAATLSTDELVEMASRVRLGGPGFAAAVACACGAFDYESDDQETAQRAIAKALGREWM